MKKTLIAMIIGLSLSLSVSALEPKTAFNANCAGCHGADGKGETKLGQKMEAQDYTDAKVQAAKKDDGMFKAIKEGLKRGDKTLMKPYAEKFSDVEIKELVKYLRAFKK